MQVGWCGNEDRTGEELRPFAPVVRKWISAGKSAPRIVERSAGVNRIVRPWRDVRHVLLELQTHDVIGDTVACPDRRASVTCRIPGEAQAWCNVAPAGIHRGPADKSGITGIREPGRSSREHRA